MKYSKWAGLSLAACACAGLVVLSMQQPGGSVSRFVGETTSGETTQGRTLHVPADLSIESPQPFAIDAALARRAVRDGELHVELADGTRYPVRIERQYTDETGHWNVVGRAQTRLGPQPMILTFGGNLVFGVLPTPDGGRLRIATGPAGEIRIAPDGGLVPNGFPGLVESDALSPPRLAGVVPGAPQGAVATPRRIAAFAASAKQAAQRTPIAPLAPAAAAPVDTTPVQIDVLAIYAPDQVSLRGSVAAVETEFANLFAIANQAHVDSGSRVRLRAVGMQQLDLATTGTNQDILTSLFAPVGGVSVEGLRDTHGADLVSVLRPNRPGDGTCGLAYVPVSPQGRTQVVASLAYGVVNNNDTCGSLVFAHEIGHNLGSMHDRETDTKDGLVTHGAYRFSFGHYQPFTFGTVMAYSDGHPWLAYFSNPASTRCGSACGVDDYADNVRSFNLMAPAIASMRGMPGTISIADVEAIEPDYGAYVLRVPVRMTGTAPPGGIALQVEVTGGTATAGVDFALESANVQMPEGAREANVVLTVAPDAGIEPDETILLRVTAPEGVVLEDADAVVTIANDDPRPVLSGRLWFPADLPKPTSPITVHADNFDGPNTVGEFQLSPPDFAYSLAVPYGAQLYFTPQLPDPYVIAQPVVNELRQTRQWHLFPEKGMLVTGHLSAEAGMALPQGTVSLTFSEVRGGSRRDYWADFAPPDYTFSRRVPRGTHVSFTYGGPYAVEGNPASFQPLFASTWDIAADAAHELVLSTLPSLRVFPMDNMSPQILGQWVVLHLEGTAPPGGTTFRCRSVDGTAKAGVDYVAFSETVTVPEGTTGFVQCGTLEILWDAPGQYLERPEYFDVVIDQVSGARLTTDRARVSLLGKSPRTGGPQRSQHR